MIHPVLRKFGGGRVSGPAIDNGQQVRLGQLLFEKGVIFSRAEGRRLASSKAIFVDGVVEPDLTVTLKKGQVVRVGLTTKVEV